MNTQSMNSETVETDVKETTSPERERTNHLWIAVSDVFFLSKIYAGLKHTGYPMRRVRSALELQEGLKRQVPALIILDMANEALDAVSILEQLKSDEENRAIPILAYANHEDVAAFRRAQTLGVTKIVNKGIFSLDMHDLVKEILEPQDEDEL